MTATKVSLFVIKAQPFPTVKFFEKVIATIQVALPTKT